MAHLFKSIGTVPNYPYVICMDLGLWIRKDPAFQWHADTDSDLGSKRFVQGFRFLRNRRILEASGQTNQKKSLIQKVDFSLFLY